MVTAGDFRNGVTFDMDGSVMQIIEFQHVKPGKGAAFVRTKLRNVITGAVVEKTFNPTDKYPTAHVERKDMQYLYNDGDLYYFMDMETYEQLPINKDKLGDNFKLVKEEMMCTIVAYKDNVIAVDPPSPQRLRPAHRSRFRSLSISATSSRLIQEPVNISKERKFFPYAVYFRGCWDLT